MDALIELLRENQGDIGDEEVGVEGRGGEATRRVEGVLAVGRLDFGREGGRYQLLTGPWGR